MVSSPRGAAGEGRPTAAWSYAPEPPRPKGKRETTPVTLSCPHCAKHVRVNVPWDRKKHRKKVPLTVLLCSACEAVWQWRAPLAEGEVTCPGCRHSYDPRKGNVPQKGYFQCRGGNKDRIIESIRLSPKDRRLPVRPYALQAYLVDQPEERIESGWQQAVLFEDMPIQQPLPFTRRGIPEALLLLRNGKFFKHWSASDQARLQRAEMLWAQHKTSLPYPKSAIPRGAETARLLEHHYNHWHEMFGARQLLTLSTLLAGIMAEQEEKLRELLLCAFSGVLESNNVFTRQRVSRKSAGGQTAEGVFGRHDFQPKNTLAENNIGLSGIAGGTWLSQLVLCRAGIEYRSLAGISFVTTRVKAAVNWSLIC